MSKTVGIIMDDYKIKHFERALSEGKYKVISKTPNAPNQTLIKIEVEDERMKELEGIVRKTDLECKATRN